MSLIISECPLLLEKIKQCGSLERAESDRRYHKSTRLHWGVPAAESKQLARTFSEGLDGEELLDLAETLWTSGHFDPMICAARILDLPKVKASPALWERVKKFLNDVDGWALEDTLAHAAWKCLLADEQRLDEVEEWTVHPNFWMRRAALVYTLPFAKKGRDPERMLKWAGSYVDDGEWFIQKAIGWWLRVLGEESPDRVVDFLKLHWSQLKGVARREATRKLPRSPSLWQSASPSCPG